MLSSLKMIKTKLRIFAKRTPWIYRIGKTLRDKRSSNRLCSRNKDLCLEGCPSSANSFTYVLLRNLNSRLDIAHHCHSVANIKIALEYGIPTIILVRNPEDAVSSQMARFGSDPDESLLMYIDFYEFVLEHIEELLVLTFEDITQDTERSIKRISAATGIELSYNDLDALKSRVFVEIEEWNKKHGKSKNTISLPEPKRKVKAERLKEKVRSSSYYEEAIGVWQNLVSKTGRKAEGASS